MADYLWLEWLDIVLLGAVLVCVLSLGLVFLCLAQLRRQAAIHEQSQQRWERELKVIQSSAVGLGKRLVELEQKLELVMTTAQSVPPQDQSLTTMDDNLQDAASLLNAGVTPEEVARRCSISKAEASLLKLMQAQMRKEVAA